MRTRSASPARTYLAVLAVCTLAGLAIPAPGHAQATPGEAGSGGKAGNGSPDDGDRTPGPGSPAAQADPRDSTPLAVPVPMADSVRRQLEAGETTDLWLVFEDSADLAAAARIEDWARRGEAVVEALRATAAESQAGAIRELDASGADYEPHWVTNRIFVRDADRSLAGTLAADPEVSRIAEDAAIEQVEPSPGRLLAQVQAVEWGIAAINADDVWNEFGVRGEGITVASIDGGVDFRHPALAGAYRGNLGDGTFDHNYNWFDADGRCPAPEPCDDPDGHGTHTMGTMVGDDGDGNRIGVAPEATWIAANGCCPTEEALVSSAEWMLAPTDLAGGNPRPDLRPHIVNNSWGAANGPEEDPLFDEILQAWTAAGIFHTFAIGNSGPGCDTAASPGDSVHTYGVGGFAADGTPYTDSSRGPGADGLVRPNISAPAVNVRSSLPGGEYGAYNGTSMAAPHVSATAALMWSAAPALVGDIRATRALLDRTAADQAEFTCGGTAEANNTWGQGRLDALAAVAASPRGAAGRLEGTVTDATTGEPLPGARVSVTGPSSRSLTTEADGSYGAPLSPGEYEVTVERYGYQTATATASVTADATATVDLTLEPAGEFAVAGQVTDARGGPVPGATVTLEGTPLPPVTTGSDGAYAFGAVPAGRYVLGVTSPHGCADDAVREVVVHGITVANVGLPDSRDAFGYRCVPEPSAYLDAGPAAGGEEVALTGDDEATAIELPFTVWLYGSPYQTAYLSTNGHLNFVAPDAEYSNGALPDSSNPNAAIYPFWDDLLLDADSHVYTRLVGSGDGRRLVVEWRNATFYADPDLRLDFQVVLARTGDVTLTWRGLDAEAARELGVSATVGVENATGTAGLAYSVDSAVLSDARSVRFTPPPSGLLSGTVTDRNDGGPIGNATVVIRQGDQTVRTLVTGADGTYEAQLRTGDYTLEISAGGYRARRSAATVRAADTTTVNRALPSARAEIEAVPERWVLPPAGTGEATVAVANTGTVPLRWSVVESGGGPVPEQRHVEGVGRVTVPSPGPAVARAPAAPPGDLSPMTAGTGPPGSTPGGARGVDAAGRDSAGGSTTGGNAAGGEEQADARAGGRVTPFLAGDVLSSWPVGGVDNAWGVGYRSGELPAGGGEVWVGDPGQVRNHGFTPAGVRTTGPMTVPWAASWQADFAADTRRGLMCQVNVGGDNGIHCFDPEAGPGTGRETGPGTGPEAAEEAYRILGYPWDRTSQRGLAYRADDDTFYIGGWNEDVIYHVAGKSHGRQGEVLGSCPFPGIAGLAWHAPTGTLWVTTSTPTNDIHQVNPEDCSIVASMAGPDPEPYSLAGLALDHAGRLWLSSQDGRRVYQVDGDQRADVSWLEVTPGRSRVPAGGSGEVRVAVDAQGLPPGVYRAAVVLETNAGRRPVVSFAVEIVVSASWTGIDAGEGKDHTDTDGLSWNGDQEYAAGSYGWVGESRSRTLRPGVEIEGTEDDVLYRSLRRGMSAYRLDDLPSGAYEVTLGFAEPARSPRVDRRVFDVDLNGDYVLVGYDIARAVGGRRADRHTFTVDLEDGEDLRIGFHRRRGYAPPIVSALQIVQRPDR